MSIIENNISRLLDQDNKDIKHIKEIGIESKINTYKTLPM